MKKLWLALAFAACGTTTPDAPATNDVPPDGATSEDTSTKEPPRLMPAEAYMRSYLTLFGGLAPIPAQKALRGADGSQLFDAWDDYLLTLGFADYRVDIPRQSQPNALMVASFERIGLALCDRALEHDWIAAPPPPADQRLIFAFDMPANPDKTAFTAGFDVLHRTLLGYPVSLAPTARVDRFFELYNAIVKAHGQSRFTPAQAGWAAMCCALVRHPEFHLY